MKAGIFLENRDNILLTQRALLSLHFLKKSLVHIFNEVERESIQKPDAVVV